MPDPFVIAILLTIVTAALALLIGDWSGLGEDETRLVALLDAWRDPTDGLWKFLAFAMQMCLILITGHAVAMTRPVRGLIDMLASIPQTTASAALLVGGLACVAGVLNWGLGLIVGAFMAREVGRSMSARGIRAHYPLLCAAGFMGLLVWHGGLSGSAPLSMTTHDGAAKVIPEQYLAELRPHEGVPLTETVFSGLNVFVTGGLCVIVPLLLFALAPRRLEDVRSIDAFPRALAEADSESEGDHGAPLPEWLDTSPIVILLLAIPLLLLLVRYASTAGVARIGLNEINVAMLLIGLVLHGSVRSYMRAATEGARGCAGIIIQFPLYAGIMAMMSSSGLIELIADWFTRIGNETTIPLLSFGSAGVVNLFVPSGGGQWGIQGPVALQTGMDAGIGPGKMIMAVAYGDQLTNMLQPFWALPLLGITGVRARDIVGYTAIIMLAAAVWIGAGLLMFG